MTSSGCPVRRYEELTKIIKAYADCRVPSGPSEVGTRAAIDQTIVSRNNAFLLAIGVIEGGNKKQATDTGRKLAGALDYEMPDDIRARWREIVTENEFFQKIVSAVRIRKAMEPSALKAHIAYSAGQPKKSSTTTGAGAIVDILLAAGLINEADGKFTASSVAGRLPDSTMIAASECITDAAAETAQCSVHRLPHRGLFIEQTFGPVQVQVQIQVRCSIDEISSLAPVLKAMMKELSTTSDEPSSDE